MDVAASPYLMQPVTGFMAGRIINEVILCPPDQMPDLLLPFSNENLTLENSFSEHFCL